jgi:hypothetical protein
MNKETQVLISGKYYDFDTVVNLMDDDIREYLHMQLAPCSEQEFINTYLQWHFMKYNQEFVIN